MSARIVIGAALGVLLAYLVGAFAGWEFNPGNWQREARLYWICFAAGLAVMGGGAGGIKP